MFNINVNKHIDSSITECTVDRLALDNVSASRLIHHADRFLVCTVSNMACGRNELGIELQSTVGEHRPLTVRNHNPLKLLKYQP